MIITPLWLVGSALGGGFFAAGGLRLLHNYNRQKQMACSCGSIWGVHKVYQMIPLDHKKGDYAFFVFASCNCGNVRFIRSENKRFTPKQIARRWKNDPEQFVIKVNLFVRSRIVVQTNSTLLTPDIVTNVIRLTYDFVPNWGT